MNSTYRRFLLMCVSVTTCWHQDLVRRATAQATMRLERFDRDPGWDGLRNRLLADPLPVTRQDFGWSSTRHASGREPGEIGGWIQRSLSRATYALPLTKTLTLDDRLEASGRLAVTRDDGSSGVLIGWFHDSSRGWRTPNSLALRVDGNSGKYWLFYEYGTGSGNTGGAGAFEGERYQDTPTAPFPADGTAHDWRLLYDPTGGEGYGEVVFHVDRRTYRLALPESHHKDGAAFNRFGFWNQETTGSGMEIWLDDLTINGKCYSFDAEPSWEQRGNHTQHQESLVRPYSFFGFSPTQYAGGGPGEAGGIIWRDERPCYYADNVGPLSLDDELDASGTMTFLAAGPDSAVYLGWFDSHTKRTNDVPEIVRRQRNYLALLLEGPSRVGHYFRPGYGTSTGRGLNDAEGPVLNPGKRVHRWSLHYQPDAAGGQGQITAKLDDHERSITLSPQDRDDGARFDRFGLFNMQTGGWHVQVFIDDVKYTAASDSSRR